MKRWGLHLVCLMLFALQPPVFASTFIIPEEHNWVFHAREYAFGLRQTAPIVTNVGNERVVLLPRTIWIYFGPWSVSFENDTTSKGIASLAILGIAGVTVVGVFKLRHLLRDRGKRMFTA